MKEFAIINLKTLRVIQFDHRGELKNVILKFKADNMPHLVLRWHDDSECYSVMEVHEL